MPKVLNMIHNIHNFVKVGNYMKDIRRDLANIFNKVGMRDVDANILAEILILDEAVSVDELSEKLGYSISGITSSLHRLMKMHLVFRNKNGRKYVYQSNSNVLSALFHLIEDIKRYDIHNLLRKINNEISDYKDEKIKKLRNKIEEANKYLIKILTILNESIDESKELSEG